MSNLYLVRHGQAGTRDAYDRLSDLGRRQAMLLGEYFAEQGLHFSAAYCGSMRRQQETGLEVSNSYRRAGLGFPDLSCVPSWNEFDLDHIYREIAPALCEEDPEFRDQYQSMKQQVRASEGEHAAEVHRRWLPCDSQIVRAWIAGKHSFEGESWEAFRQRVTAPRSEIHNGVGHANIIVFTSAMPVAVWTALSLDIADGRILKLAAALQNTSYTVLRLKADDLSLLTFNASPHLVSDDLRTRR